MNVFCRGVHKNKIRDREFVLNPLVGERNQKLNFNRGNFMRLRDLHSDFIQVDKVLPQMEGGD